MTEKKIWHQYYPEEVPATLEYPEAYLTDFFWSRPGSFPTGTPFTSWENGLPTGNFWMMSLLCPCPEGSGVRKGERVSIMLPNSPQAVIAYYGTLFAGAVVVQTNPMYMERELKHQLTDSGAETIVCVDLVFDKVKRVMDETPLKRVIVTSIKDYLPFPKNILYPLKMLKRRQSGGHFLRG